MLTEGHIVNKSIYVTLYNLMCYLKKIKSLLLLLLLLQPKMFTLGCDCLSLIKGNDGLFLLHLYASAYKV